MAKKRTEVPPVLLKCPTGIKGFDEITEGGLPRRRPSLVCGSAGSGKTLLAMEFLVRGASEYNEPGLMVTFEEEESEIAQNIASFNWGFEQLVKQRKLIVDHVHVERSEIEETGEYDLEGLFIRLGQEIDSIAAKRVVLDTAEALFGSFSNEAILRTEFRRLCTWLKDKGVTSIITAEPGEKTLTKFGIEEYVSDCVIVLDHRIIEEIATRRLRIVKYRGSKHGTNEYPFLISDTGLSVLPITSLGLDYDVSTERISTGIDRLDTMFGNIGYYRGTSVLVSGTAGTGKSSVAAAFADAACARGESCLYFSFEEAAKQIVRNMSSIGIDLQKWVDSGLLQFQASRATAFGLEMHLAVIHKAVDEFKPQVVVIDPVSNLISSGNAEQVKSILTRIIDYLKMNCITTLFTDLTHGGEALEATESAISSLMDTWILLRDIEINEERNRCIYILKSRGMAHSNQIREFLLTDKGIDLLDVYVGPAGVLTGTARTTQIAEEKASKLRREQEIAQLQRELERKQKAVDAQVIAIQADFEAEKERISKLINEAKLREEVLKGDRKLMAKMRGQDQD